MPRIQKFDVHQEITNRIVDAIETAEDFRLPWIKSTVGSFARPLNIASKNPYNGVNIVSLWVAALAADFPSNIWGTYRQWQEKGYQVRRGEKSSLVVFYKSLAVEETNKEKDETEIGQRLIARASTVFNAAQVEGFDLPTASLPDGPLFDPVDNAEQFAAATGALIEEGGERACYIPSLDFIRMPDRRRFTSTETSAPAEAFYSTLCHELVHYAVSWIMPHGRVRRPLRLLSAMRQFGIIRAFRGKRAAHRLGDNARYAFLGWQPARAPFPSAACRRGYRSGLFPRIRAQAIERSRIGRHHDAAIPSPCCAATCAA